MFDPFRYVLVMEMIPEITHLQAYVIKLVSSDEHSGRFIRSALKEAGVPMSAAAFYQLMARLEKADLVSGHYVVSVVDGQTLKERRYHATLRGIKQFLDAVNFYVTAKKTSAIPRVVETALNSTTAQ